MKTNFSEQFNALQDNYIKGVQDILENISTNYNQTLETFEAKNKNLDDFYSRAFQRYLDKRTEEDLIELKCLKNKVVELGNEILKLQKELADRTNKGVLKSEDTASLQIKKLGNYFSKEILIEKELIDSLKTHKDGLLQKEKSGAELTKEEENALEFFESFETIEVKEKVFSSKNPEKLTSTNASLIESDSAINIDNKKKENKEITAIVKDISEKTEQQVDAINIVENLSYENNPNPPNIETVKEEPIDNKIDFLIEKLSVVQPELFGIAEAKESSSKKATAKKQLKPRSKGSLSKKIKNSDLSELVKDPYNFSPLQHAYEGKKYDDLEFKNDLITNHRHIIEEVYKIYSKTEFESKELDLDLVVTFILSKLTKNG